MNCNFLSTKIIRWYNDNSGKIEKIFHIQVLGKDLGKVLGISDFTCSDLENMKRSAQLLFRACCLFDPRVPPSLWAMCSVAPVNAE